MSQSTATIHLPTLRAISAFVSKEETRYYLGGVLVTTDALGASYVATDGHRLAARRVDLGPDDPPNGLLGKWIIPTDACKALKPNRRSPLQTATMTVDGLNLHLQHDGNGISCKAIDGTFPHWESLVPSDVTGATTMGLNGVYLAGVDELAKSLEIGRPLIFWNDGGPACFGFSGCEKTMALIMPVRNPDDAKWTRPAWIGR